MRRKHREYKRSFTWKVERHKTKLHGIEPKKTKFSTTTNATKETKQEKSTILFFISMWIQIVHDVGVVSFCVYIVF